MRDKTKAAQEATELELERRFAARVLEEERATLHNRWKDVYARLERHGLDRIPLVGEIHLADWETILNHLDMRYRGVRT